MGQYYHAVILNPKSFKREDSNENKVIAILNPHHYDNGAKLMEFSYINNDFVGAVQTLFQRGVGKYAGYPLVFAGDYADEELQPINGEKRNIYSLLYDEDDESREEKLMVDGIKPSQFRYIINEDDKQYVDTINQKEDKYGYSINPLPILCCEGNGRGGGDYWGKNQRFVGKWARKRISVSNEIPEGYTELKRTFVEKREEY